jgi:hypothetical protein
MKFCPVVPEICRGQVHGARKERRITRTRRRIIIIITRNGAKTISLHTLFGRLNYCMITDLKFQNINCDLTERYNNFSYKTDYFYLN